MKLLYWIKDVPFSFVCNCVWWIGHLGLLRKTWYDYDGYYKEVASQEENYKNLSWLAPEIGWFEYIPDKIDWRSWKITFIARSGGDCEDFAIFGVWLLGLIGIPAKIRYLRKKGTMVGHAICVADDKSVIISNNKLIQIGRENRDRSILSYFNGAYDAIV